MEVGAREKGRVSLAGFEMEGGLWAGEHRPLRNWHREVTRPLGSPEGPQLNRPILDYWPPGGIVSAGEFVMFSSHDNTNYYNAVEGVASTARRRGSPI